MPEDMTRTCCDCGAEWLDSVADQQYRADKGFTNEPKRCRECRDIKRASHGDPAPREMHPAICDQCGGDCTVPFKPRFGLPIYCQRCFREREGVGAHRRIDSGG